MYYVLMTLDLDNVDSEKRKTFYEILEKEKWSKCNNLTTTWTCSFKEGVKNQDVIAIVKEDIDKAKQNAKVTKVNAVFQIGTEPHITI